MVVGCVVLQPEGTFKVDIISSLKMSITLSVVLKCHSYPSLNG